MDKPRLLTIEEATEWREETWLELRNVHSVWVCDCTWELSYSIPFVKIERLRIPPIAVPANHYNRGWRCWDKRPSMIQRKKVKWDD